MCKVISLGYNVLIKLSNRPEHSLCIPELGLGWATNLCVCLLLHISPVCGLAEATKKL